VLGVDQLTRADGGREPADNTAGSRDASSSAGVLKLRSSSITAVIKDPRMWSNVLREPLVHFVVIGILLYGAGEVGSRLLDAHRIVVTPQHVAHLANGYALQFGGLPDANTLEALVQRDIRDEVLFREGIAQGLDRNDEIVRRRVVQKMQFLTQDLNVPPEPTMTQLQAYLHTHPERYTEPQRVSFTHIFFSPAREGWAKAQLRAASVLQGLGQEVARAPQLGDPFPDLYDYTNYDPGQLSRLFGPAPITTALFSEPTGRWAGPVKSAYGWHLIRIENRSAQARPTFSAVRERIRTDYLHDAQERTNNTALKRLVRRYTVLRKDQAQ
jgi:peptidyl-prolyl cis-trans isomerase C